MTFAGLGAWLMSVIGGHGGSPIGLVAATGISALVGMLLALPSLRLQGLYLALATLAFAVGMDNAFFNTSEVFGASLALPVARVALPGISLETDRAYLIFLSIVVSLVGIAMLSMRRSRYGRRLVAMANSPTACLSLGIGLVAPKLTVFTVAAGLAGFGGALYGGAELVVAPKEFGFVLSQVVLLIGVLLGIRTVTGMLLAGTFIAISPLLGLIITWPRDFVQLTVGLAATGVAANPEGSVGAAAPLQAWREKRAARAAAARGIVAAEGSSTNARD
jgi:branched-chain amino acid transport system permease protein